MSNGYNVNKGLGCPKIEKSDTEKFLTLRQLKHLLACVKEHGRKLWRRDHCLIYLGFNFGLRSAEAAILERENFRFLDSGQVLIRTKKQAPRLPMHCPDCSRKWRVSCARVGTDVHCPRCNHSCHVKIPKKKIDMNPPERPLPVVENRVAEYVQDYMDQHMREDQRWFFEGPNPKNHICVSSIRKIFNFYVERCDELSNAYSYHSLRHGRGVLIYERFQDHVMTRDSLRQKSLSSAEWYMHLSPQRKQEYQSALDDVAAEMEEVL